MAGDRYVIRSMTGFGRGVAETESLHAEVEVKGVNHRFLDIKMRLPAEMGQAEPALRARVQSLVGRGRIDVVAVLTSTRPVEHRVEMNRGLIAGYLEAVRTLGKEFHLKGSPGIEALLALPGALAVRPENPGRDAASTDLLQEALDKALEAYGARTRLEGERLALDLKSRLAAIRGEVQRVEGRAAGLTECHATRLRERLAVLLREDRRVDEIRLAQEVALMASRVDITEELTRLEGHLDQAAAEIDAPRAPIGKVLDFLMQEMNREANTISSKAEDLAICQSALRIRSEVEKIREQVQNLE